MRLAVLGLAFLVVAGCASLGYQRRDIPVPRATLALAYADAKSEYAVARYLVSILCAEPSPRLSASECAMARGVDARAKDVDARVRALLLADDPNTLDLDAALAVARGLAPLLLGLAGIRLPVIPTP